MVDSMDLVSDERGRLITTLERVGGDAPTLCEGWVTEDLLRHLVVREIYPHVALSSKIPGKLTAGQREKMAELESASYEELLDEFRNGRQKYSPLNLSAVDKAFNTLEYVIHHEDVRRAQTPALGRVLPEKEQKEIFSSLKALAQLNFLKAPAQIVLNAPGVGSITVLASKRHDKTVTITGTPLELAMYAFGRDICQVVFDGDEDAIKAVQSMNRSS